MSARADIGEVQTVMGAVPPHSLGLVLPHEHILCDVTPPELTAKRLVEVEITPEIAHDVRYYWVRHFGNHILMDPATCATEVARFVRAGGGTIVELTIRGMAPDPLGLKRVSQETGVHIVAGTGYYIEAFAGDLIGNRTVDVLAADMICDAQSGFGATGVRAGIIGEIGVSDPWTEREQRVMRAAVLAQHETGLAINVHPGRDPSSPFAVARFIRAAGGDLTRLIFSHMDRTLFQADALANLMDEGCVAEWDFFGIESSYYPFADIDLPNDGQRLQLIKALVDRGYGDRVLISQDICTKSRLVRYGGHGYAHLPLAVVPMMQRKGFSEHAIAQITRLTPQRLLTRVAQTSAP